MNLWNDEWESEFNAPNHWFGKCVTKLNAKSILDSTIWFVIEIADGALVIIWLYCLNKRLPNGEIISQMVYKYLKTYLYCLHVCDLWITCRKTMFFLHNAQFLKLGCLHFGWYGDITQNAWLALPDQGKKSFSQNWLKRGHFSWILRRCSQLTQRPMWGA